MRLYDRGIRRRLAPMLQGDRRRIELAYSLQFSMPGHAGAAVRRGDRHGREPGTDGPRGDPHTDAVGRRPERRLLDGAAPAALAACRSHPRQVRRRAGSTSGAAARPRLAAALVRAADPHAAGVPGDRYRRVHGRSTCPCPGRCWPTGSTRPRARSCCCTTSPDSGRDGRPRQAGRHRRSTVRGLRRRRLRTPDAQDWPGCHSTAGATAGSGSGEATPLEPVRAYAASTADPFASA